MNTETDRLAELRKAKLRALARTRWEVGEDAKATAFPGGATLSDPTLKATFVLTEEDAERKLGAALAVALRAGATRLEVFASDATAAGILARRADLLTFPISVWLITGTELAEAEAAPPAADVAPAPEAELYRPILEAAGLTPVVEGGFLLGELLGLEVARVVVDDDGTARVEAGVGRFDREAGTMVRAGMAEADALHVVVDLVAPVRRADAERHPMNQLVRDRWLRAVVQADPALVGAEELRPVGSAVPRRNLTEDGVASLVGTDLDGRPLVVSCSTGVYLDLVPAALDDRCSHAPEARLVIVVPELDEAPITKDLLAFAPDTTLVTVPANWNDLSPAETALADSIADGVAAGADAELNAAEIVDSDAASEGSGEDSGEGPAAR